uniref:Uncharacterized protein n=1 Tax=Rhizophora mucronata TaxID=61149 RepID=A0A2P2PRM9_RHIMU
MKSKTMDVLSYKSKHTDIYSSNRVDKKE